MFPHTCVMKTVGPGRGQANVNYILQGIREV